MLTFIISFSTLLYHLAHYSCVTHVHLLVMLSVSERNNLFHNPFQKCLTKFLGSNRCSIKLCQKRNIGIRKEYRYWKSWNSDTGCISHYLEKNPPVYMCELLEVNDNEQNSRILQILIGHILCARFILGS